MTSNVGEEIWEGRCFREERHFSMLSLVVALLVFMELSHNYFRILPDNASFRYKISEYYLIAIHKTPNMALQAEGERLNVLVDEERARFHCFN